MARSKELKNQRNENCEDVVTIPCPICDSHLRLPFGKQGLVYECKCGIKKVLTEKEREQKNAG